MLVADIGVLVPYEACAMEFRFPVFEVVVKRRGRNGDGMYPRRKAKPSCLVQKAVARPQDTKLTERYSCFFCPRHIGRRFRLGPCKKTCPPLATSSVLFSSGFCLWMEEG